MPVLTHRDSVDPTVAPCGAWHSRLSEAVIVCTACGLRIEGMNFTAACAEYVQHVTESHSSVSGHGAQSAGNEGLTDHSSRDLYGIVARLPFRQSHTPLNAGKGQESLSGGCRGAKPPALSAHAQRAPFTCQEPDKCQ
jgi:hypothetical protein